MIDLVLAHLGDNAMCPGPDGTRPDPDGTRDGNGDGDGATGSTSLTATSRLSSRPLSPEPWRALQYAMARLAIDLVSGP